MILGMSLDAFAAGEYALKVRSELLQETVLFVSNEAMRQKLHGLGLTIYMSLELKCLLDTSSSMLARAHAVKKQFDGTVVA